MDRSRRTGKLKKSRRLIAAGAFLLLLAFGWSCRYDNEEELIAAHQLADSLENKIPSIFIQSPSDFDTVTNPFTIIYQLNKWEVKKGGFHLQYFINQENRGLHYHPSTLTLSDLDTGLNLISLKLAIPDFSVVPVSDEIRVYLAPPDPASFPLIVQNGVGSGNYLEGTEVTVMASELADEEFANWQGDVIHLLDVTSAATSLIMPAAPVTITANFKPRPIDFTAEVLPIFKNECLSCHNGLYIPNLSTCDQIKANATRVREMISDPNNPMPPTGLMEQTSIDLINRWLDQSVPCTN